MGKQIRRHSIQKKLAIDGLAATFGWEELKLTRGDVVSAGKIPLNTPLTVGLSLSGISLKPPASAPPKIICEPSEMRAEEGYHLRYNCEFSILII
jgi:hypothetical protein